MSENSNQSNRPTHAIWQVTGEGKDKKGYWNRVGSGWMNRDLKGLNLRFDSIPLSGRVVVREITDQDNANEQGAGAAQGGAQ